MTGTCANCGEEGEVRTYQGDDRDLQGEALCVPCHEHQVKEDNTPPYDAYVALQHMNAAIDKMAEGQATRGQIRSVLEDLEGMVGTLRDEL